MSMKNKLFLDMADSMNPNDKNLLDEKIKNKIKTSYYEIDSSNKDRLKKEEGEYFTITYTDDVLDNFPKYLNKEIIKILKYFFITIILLNKL